VKIIIDKVQENEKKELKKVHSTIDDFKKLLNEKATDMESFKKLLKHIGTIKEASLDMELRITDIQEKYDIITYLVLSSNPKPKRMSKT
jgi:predicted  nucleic acid-binding Zn-ribbon protein